MQIVHQRCCGLDVHKKSITACVITPKGKEIRTYGTMTEELLELIDWIKSAECTCVAMESTGSLWKPIYNLIECEDIKTLVVNARHIKAVPGRKTDIKDAEWIADLARHGLLKGSFIPSRDQRELRELVRYRRSMINEHSREVNRIQKVLEGCNIKLSSVASSVVGVSGKNIITAIINDVEDPEILAQLAKGRLREKRDQLEKALHGTVSKHQKMMLATQLEHLKFLEQTIATLDQEISERMRPFEEDLELMDTIPGIGRRTAEDVLAEIGTNMSRFTTAHHLASWAGMAPGNNESAGKRKSGKTTKGNNALKAALVQAAHAAARKKGTYLNTQYGRIAARRGAKRAAVAVGHSILIMIYHMLTNRQSYIELGANYYDEHKREKTINRTIKRLEALGLKVTIEPAFA